ncbi:MAG: hypothetical protein WCH62_08620, partial [Candidatus Omnitrophota bacterium]
GALNGSAVNSKYRGAQGLDPEFIKELEKMFGFDQPWYVRYWNMLKNYATFDFGKSYFRDTRVVDLVMQKLPVSISLGVWTTLLIYLISIPLGIKKAVKDGTPFDIWTSAIVIVLHAIPSFLFAVLLLLSHPFTGLQAMLIYTVWVLYERIINQNKEIPLFISVIAPVLLMLHLFYYLVYLPSVQVHHQVFSQWKLNWQKS